jgi:hypothetical protein
MLCLHDVLQEVISGKEPLLVKEVEKCKD